MDELDLFTVIADGTLGRRTAPAIEVADPDHLRHVTLARLVVEMSRVAARPLDPIGEATQTAIDAACTIYVVQDGQTWTGSVFLIASGIVLTNSHVMPPDPENAAITVSFDGQTALHAKIRAINEDVDVEALAVEGTDGIHSVRIATEEARPGEIIAVIGSPEGWQDVVTVGRVSAVGKSPDEDVGPAWEDMIFVDAQISEGSSGSLCINVAAEAVGIVMGKIGRHAQDRGIGQNAVIPIRRVIEGLGL